MIHAANVSLPSPPLGRGAGGEGQATVDGSLQLSRFPQGRGFFTGVAGHSQRKAAGGFPLTPNPSPQRGRREKGRGCAGFRKLDAAHRVFKRASATSRTANSRSCVRGSTGSLPRTAERR